MGLLCFVTNFENTRTLHFNDFLWKNVIIKVLAAWCACCVNFFDVVHCVDHQVFFILNYSCSPIVMLFKFSNKVLCDYNFSSKSLIKMKHLAFDLT